MNAGPWLAVPPPGYGGIENVVATLVPELRARGVHVVLAAPGGSTLAADAHVAAFAEPQFGSITAPYNATVGIAHAHMQAVVRAIDEHEVDLVHDHLEVVGPAVLAALGQPALQTLHWDTGRHPEFYADFDGGGTVFFAGVSERQVAIAPPRLREQTLGAVPLAVDPGAFPFRAEKDGPCLVLARIAPLKGQHVAARLGVDVVLAGPIEDAAYWHDDVEPHVDGTRVRWVGTLTGSAKFAALARARAALFPVQWEEPGGTAVIEALACGTPVVAMDRGCMGALIEHGVTGWLARTEAEFAEGVRRAGEIDPAACRAAVLERFTAGPMADRYLELYAEVARRVSAPRTPPAGPRALVRRPPA
jgi:glycosyltransferase involved in cell wall biosynthesis